jgi:hypothetical protein
MLPAFLALPLSKGESGYSKSWARALAASPGAHLFTLIHLSAQEALSVLYHYLPYLKTIFYIFAKCAAANAAAASVILILKKR